MGCAGTKPPPPKALLQDAVPVTSGFVSTAPAGSTSTAPAGSTSTAPACLPSATAAAVSLVSDPWVATAPAPSSVSDPWVEPAKTVAPPAGVQQASASNSLEASNGSNPKDDAAPTKDTSALEKFTSQAKVVDKEVATVSHALFSGVESCVDQVTAGTAARKSLEKGIGIFQGKMAQITTKAEALRVIVTKGAEDLNREVLKDTVNVKPIGNMGEGDLMDDELQYKAPLVRFIEKPPAGHTDGTKCSDYVKKMESHLPGIKFLEEILSECRKVSDSKERTLAARTIGNMAMVFAITLYTFDLCQIKKDDEYLRSNNFYFILNIMLRKRSAAFLEVAHGYMYYLMTGLSRLPSASGQVFRGIDKTKAPDALKKFKQGTTFYFSAFSSSSPDLGNATQFAKGGGLILRIQLLDENSMSKDITALSLYPRTETEIILLPNFKVFVISITQQNGIDVIDIMEQLQDSSAVDF